MVKKTSKNISKNKDTFNKNIHNKNNQLINFDKLLVVIHVQKIDKVYDYFVLQSICLVDTISSQKPKLKTLKCKYTFGSKSVSFSCKSTLRGRKLSCFIALLNFVVVSEMQRRHLTISSSIDATTKNNLLFSFSLNNTNVFTKLDEFYFKWNYPITFNFTGSDSNGNIVAKHVQRIVPLPIGL